MGELLQLPSTPRRPGRPDPVRATQAANSDPAVTAPRQLHKCLRYGLAFVCLLALLLGRPASRSSVLALSRRQWLRLGALGLLLYFGPVALPAGQLVAVGVVAVGVVAFAGATMLGQAANRDDGLPRSR